MPLAAETTATLTDTEIGAIVGLTAFALFLVLALIAYILYKRTWEEISDSGVFTIAAQVSFSLVVICVVALLMFAGTVAPAAGLPILSGLAGVIVGKSRTATTVVAGGGATTGQQGGGSTPGQQGGGGAADQQGGREVVGDDEFTPTKGAE
jgi:Ca2+/Na+ antiporter